MCCTLAPSQYCYFSNGLLVLMMRCTKNFHAHLPGFEGFREGGRDSHLVQDVIKKDLTKYLSK